MYCNYTQFSPLFVFLNNKIYDLKSKYKFISPSCNIINNSFEVFRMLLFYKRFYGHEIKISFTVYYSLLFVSSLLSYQKTHFVFSNATLFVITSSSMFTVTGHRSFHTATLPYIIDSLDFKNESCGLSISVIYIYPSLKKRK